MLQFNTFEIITVKWVSEKPKIVRCTTGNQHDLFTDWLDDNVEGQTFIA